MSTAGRDTTNPYVGLRPYKESEREWFFGRDDDHKIFVDLVLANRLTLLFAASGVGKSSLLQAAVLPHLKDPSGENLNAVYCNDWAGDPLVSIREATLRALSARGRLAERMHGELAHLALPELFELCGHLVRHPLVLVLDQFEEFFYYHRTAGAFGRYKEQIVRLIVDEKLPISVVISMREDFALALNAFKPELPTVLFNNFYRLEKLPLGAAEAAILRPAQKLGFSYEPALLSELLSDLCTRERDPAGRAGTPVAEAVRSVEPPYIQIVCEQLFELDRGDPHKTLRLRTYTAHGKALGLLAAYIERVTAALSYPERRLASQSFSHLVTRRGTKVAHTADSLGRELRADRTALAGVLRKLEQARILRCQSQAGQTWYELYHDLFSDSVEQWNERFKARERAKKTALGAFAVVLAGVALFAAYDGGVNARGHFMQLAKRAGTSGQVELYRGQPRTADLFGLQRYLGETGLERQKIEPDQLFDAEPVVPARLYAELARRLPATERLLFYREDGDFAGAFRLVEGALASGERSRAEGILRGLVGFRSPRAMRQLSLAVHGSQGRSLVEALMQEKERLPPGRAAEEFWLEYIKDKNNQRRGLGIGQLARLKTRHATAAIVDLLRAAAPEEHTEILGSALAGEVEEISDKTVADLLADLPAADEEAQLGAIRLLSGSQVHQAIPMLNQLVEHASQPVRIAALEALSETGGGAAAIEWLLDAPEDAVASGAAAALVHSEVKIPIDGVRRRLAAAGPLARRIWLAALLARLGDPMPLARILALPEVRRRSKGPDGCALILDEDSERAVFLDAFLHLGDQVAALRTALHGASAALQGAILGCVGDDLPAEALPVMAPLLLSPDDELSKAATGYVTRLARAGRPEAFALLRRMVHGPPEQRDKAVEILAKVNLPEAVPLLADVAFDGAELAQLRTRVLQSLAEMASVYADDQQQRATIAERALALIRREADPRLRAAALPLLGQCQDLAAIPELKRLLADPAEEVSGAALEQLVELRHPQAARTVIEFFSAGGPGAARKGAAAALSSYGDVAWRTASEARLRSMLSGELKAGPPRGETHQALPGAGGARKAAAETPQKEEVVVLQELRQAGAVGDQAALHTALRSQDHAVRAAAQELAAALGEAAFREDLIAQLGDPDPDGQQAAQRIRLFAGVATRADAPLIREHSQDLTPDSARSLNEYLSRILGPNMEALADVERYPRRERRERDESRAREALAGAASTRAALWALGEATPWMGLGLVPGEEHEEPPKGRESTLGSEEQIVQYMREGIASRRRGRFSLRDMDRQKIDEILLEALNERYVEMVHESVLVLMKRKDPRATRPMVRLVPRLLDDPGAVAPILRDLARERGVKWAQIDALARDRRLLPYRAALCEEGPVRDLGALAHLTIRQRVEAASALGAMAGPCSDRLLAPLAHDPSLHVRAGAAEALAGIKTQAALGVLHQLLSDPSARVQLAAAAGLGKLADPASVPQIAKALRDPRTPLLVIHELLDALGKIKTPEAVEALVAAAELDDATMGQRAYWLLGGLKAQQVVPRLRALLRRQEAAVRAWRAYRDRPDDSQSATGAAKAGAAERPSGFLTYELALAIARLDDQESVIALLLHDLTDVREAAALGLGVRGRPELVRDLDARRAVADDPLFRHAAYRAIDTSLEVIEKHGGADELRALRSMRDGVRDREGVRDRVDWTIHEVEARLEEQQGPDRPTRSAVPARPGSPDGPGSSQVVDR